MPVAIEPTGVQHKGELVIGQFSWVFMRSSQKNRFAIRCWEDMVGVAAFRSVVISVRTRPLQAAVAEPAALHARHVTGPFLGQLNELIPDVGTR